MNILKTLSLTLCLSTLLPASVAFAEPQKIAITEENWGLFAAAKFEQVDGRAAIQLGASTAEKPVTFGSASLKGIAFENGTIEYDVKFAETRTFTGIRFRNLSPKDGENIYLRPHRSGLPDASQYMTNYNGLPSWQLYSSPSHAQPLKYKFNEWMRVKLVVQGNLADYYIGDSDKPGLSVELKRDPTTGAVVFWGLDLGGASWISNFTIDTDSNEKIIGTQVPEAVATKGTILSWQVSNAVDSADILNKSTLSKSYIDAQTFTKMSTEGAGLLNLAQLQGIAKGADTALAKITITSDSEQVKAFEYGFSDDVTVYLNGQAIASGSDRIASRDYRFLGTVGFYDTAWLTLKKGKNELVLAITEDTGDTTGWAVQGRFKDAEGITINK